MRARHVLVFAAAVALTASALGVASGFKWESSVFYQPDAPLRARMGSVEEFAAYCKQLEKVCLGFFAADTTPERLDIVVGLKPGKKVRVWFVSSRRTNQDSSLVALRKKLEAVPPYAVHGGPVAFALRCTIAGGGPASKEKGDYQPPMPKEWRPKGEEPELVPDGVFERIWRD